MRCLRSSTCLEHLSPIFFRPFDIVINSSLGCVGEPGFFFEPFGSPGSAKAPATTSSGPCYYEAAKAERRSPGRLPTFRPGLLFLQRAATRGQPHTAPPRSESFEKSNTTRASSTPRSPSARPRRPQSARQSPVAAGVLPTRATRPPNTFAQRRTSSLGWAAPAATSR